VTRLRARRLNRADAQSSGEGAARPPLRADDAGESWSGRGHRGCTHRCLSRAGVFTSVLGSLTRPPAGAQATCPPLACCRGTVVTCSRPSTPRCRCGRAALCAHGHGGQVRACRVVRARARHACEAFASPAADAPSRARRLSHVDARSSGEGGARPPLCADEAGESWSGRGHRGCTRRCLSRAGVRTPVLGSLTRPAAGARCWWRFQVQGRIGGACRQTAVDAAIWKFATPSSLCKTRQQCTTQYALGPGNERPPCAFRAKVRRETVKNLGNPAIVQPVCAAIDRTIFIHVSPLGA